MIPDGSAIPSDTVETSVVVEDGRSAYMLNGTPVLDTMLDCSAVDDALTLNTPDEVVATLEVVEYGVEGGLRNELSDESVAIEPRVDVDD